jgi:NAD-dependent dihydropyrimidine dehydrogenase PreA subunit
MTFVITQPCIDTMDQSCVEVCPVDCIHFEEGADRMLYINPAECIDCGACQPACPVSAIFPEADVPPDQAQFIPVNSGWYEDKAAARAAVAGVPALGGGEAAPRTAATPAPAAAAAAPAAAAATPASAAASTVEPARAREDLGAYRYGEGGIEGKCAICGQYVTKGGVKFRTKSVLCPEDAERLARIGDPYSKTPGRR